MRVCLSFLLLSACGGSSDALVDKGVALIVEYMDAYCAVAAEPGCETDEATCAFQPYASLNACENAVDTRFTDCPDIWAAAGEREAEVRDCIDALGALSCGAQGLCDSEGASILWPDACSVMGELEGLWCDGADTCC